MARRPFKAHRDGSVTCRLQPVEAEVFATLLSEFRILAENPEAGGPDVARRMQVAAYPDDPLAEDDFRATQGAAMSAERLTQASSLERAVVDGRLSDGSLRTVIAADDVDLWLMVINQLRVAYGTALGVDADTEYDVIDDNDEDGNRKRVYLWLGALLELLLDETA